MPVYACLCPFASYDTNRLGPNYTSTSVIQYQIASPILKFCKQQRTKPEFKSIPCDFIFAPRLAPNGLTAPQAQTGSPPRAAHFPNKATRMPPLGASTSSSVVDVAQSWRVRVGGNNLTGAGAVLSNGDIVLVGAMGHRGEESLRGSFAPGSTGARDYFASRLDAAGGDPLWRREASSFAVNGLDDFVFTAVGATSTERTDSEGTGGFVGEAVLLGGCTEDRWNDAADPEEGSGSQYEIGTSGAYAAAVKLDASDGMEVWRFRDAAQGEDGRGDEGCILGVASDRQGDFFLVGYVIGGVGREMAPPAASRSDIDIDFLVIKLDGATGKVDWRLQHGTTSDDGVFFAGATDSGGNLIAAGYTEGKCKHDTVVVLLDWPGL